MKKIFLTLITLYFIKKNLLFLKKKEKKMNNNTNSSENFYPSKTSIFNMFRSYKQQEIDVILIPMGLIGVLLNILALIVLRSDKFNLPFFGYLKAYTYASLFICLINITQFTAGARTILPFTNSIGTARYYCYIFYPFQVILNTYGSSLDIILSMERVVLLSKRLEWFKKIKPNVLCFIFFIISVGFSSPYWFLFAPAAFKRSLSKTETLLVHINGGSRYISKISDYIFKMPYVIDTIPIIMETFFNILSVYLIKEYTKNKKRITGNNGINKNDAPTLTNNAPTVAGQSRRSESNRAKKMEVKLAILVIFLSIFSTM
jgi:hypothetical protein